MRTSFLLVVFCLVAIFSGIKSMEFEEAFEMTTTDPALLEFENSLEQLSEALASGELEESVLDEVDMDEEMDVDADADAEVEAAEAALEESEFYQEAYKKFCGVTCKAGFKAKTRAGYKPTSNGCGAAGNGFIAKTFRKYLNKAPASFISCCNTHDICYGTCGASRESCDSKFGTCLTNAVNAMLKKAVKSRTSMEKTCINLKLNKVFTTAVTTFGCSPFKSAQTSACTCVKK